MNCSHVGDLHAVFQIKYCLDKNEKGTARVLNFNSGFILNTC